MKKGIVTVVIILTGFGLFAQNTAKNVLETELIKMLQSDRILLNQQEKECVGDCTGLGLWKNEKQK